MGPAVNIPHAGHGLGAVDPLTPLTHTRAHPEIQTTVSPFFLLAIDLPPPPVFQDVVEKNIIPQVPLAELVSKYDGVTFQEARGMIRRYKVLRLPPFVILHYRRFTRNNFVEERNPTIVNFPVRGLDLAETVRGEGASATETEASVETAYDLVANITHEATPGSVRDGQVWRVQVHTRLDGEPISSAHEIAARRQRVQRRREEREQRAEARRKAGLPPQRPAGEAGEEEEDDDDEEEEVMMEEKWYQIQDLFVEEVNRQMLFLGETYIQIWERKGGSGEVARLMEHMARKQQAQKHKAPANGKPAPPAAGAKPKQSSHGR